MGLSSAGASFSGKIVSKTISEKVARSEPLEEALTVSVTCKPTLVTRAPTWKDGGGNGG